MARHLILICSLIAVALGQSTPSLQEKAKTMLEQALADRNPNHRKDAVVALSLAASREPLLSRLESMLSDKDVQVRLAVVSSLEDLKSQSTNMALQRALHDPVPEVSFAAAKALFELHDPAGEQALLSVLGGKTKTASFFISKEMRDAMRMMHTPHETFMFALRQGIGFAPVPGLGVGVASLQQLLSDPGISGRATAALLLGKDKNEQTLQALRSALSDNDWSVRAAAVHSLALWNDPELISDFIPLLYDKNEAVRLRAAAGYLRLAAIHETTRSRHVGKKTRHR